jgi:hypothetical protein
VASNLGCVGLAVEDSQQLASLIRDVRPQVRRIGHADGVDVFRWEDPASGARLVFEVRETKIADFTPSFASTARTRLAGLSAVNEDVATARVVDDDGEQVTSVALDLEQRRLLGSKTLDREAAIVALGRGVAIYSDAEAFAASPGSLVDPEADLKAEAPAHYVERGFKWPPRMASESFVSYGVFGDPARASPTARLNGVVISASARTVERTG